MAEANQDGVRLMIASSENKAHEVIANGADMVDWVDIRKIRWLLPTEALSLYRLKSNRPPLWNRVANNLSFPNSSCSNVEFAPASHVWWTCPRAQQH
ncbi:hypothetical protein CCR75_001921 [Bremia lactucae]|uniref:Uncharacterized protein n=1 Tax=Bremia lactucae TaxID=4779 RepID=A0A976FHH6_BRELC|nr:hypothetical protein CCR75_001921 [Bremia lactucae]